MTLNELKLTNFEQVDVTSDAVAFNGRQAQGKYLDLLKILALSCTLAHSMAAPDLNQAATSARSASVMPVALFMGICRVTTVC